MKEIAIYTRKSVKGDDNSISINSQIDVIKNYFKQEDCNFTIFKDDGFSGGNTNRPAFKELLIEVNKNKYDIVACYKLDRIARNTLDFLTTFESLKNCNTELICVEDSYDPRTPAGRLMMTLLASLAEMERENIKQRVNDSMDSLAKNGRWTGGTPPFGYEVITSNTGKYLSLINKNDLKYIFSEFANGKGIVKLSNELNFDKKKISRILHNITYLKSSNTANTYLETLGYSIYRTANGNGYLPYKQYININGKKIKNTGKKIAAVSSHEGIIDINLFIKIQERLKLFEGREYPRVSKKTYLAQLVKCKCGSTMSIVLGHKKKDGTRKSYFMCPKKCGYPYIDVIELELLVLNLLKDENQFLSLFEDKNSTKSINSKSAKNNITKKISKKTSIMNGLIDKLALATPSVADILLSKIDSLNNEISTLKKELIEINSAKENANNINKSFKELDKIRIDFTENYESFSIEDRQTYIRYLFNYIVLDDASIKIF